MDRFGKTLLQIWGFEECESSCSVKPKKDCLEDLCINGVFGTKTRGLGTFIKLISELFESAEVLADSFCVHWRNLLTVFGKAKHLLSPGCFASPLIFLWVIQLELEFPRNFAA